MNILILVPLFQFVHYLSGNGSFNQDRWIMKKRIVLTIILWINFFFVFPCGWDSDTIAMEKRTFPTVHELITGKFLQHSQELYYWRVADRKEKIILYPDSLSLYDDLAWALNKIGEPEKGIDVMLEKEKIHPGLYKTYANLGTCYIHSKQLEKGLIYIKKAIEINPEAHFGREVYQKYLVEYVLSKKDSLGNFTLPLGTINNNFFHYLKIHHFKSSTKNEVAKAIKGVGGMMKFSNHNSPILLEVLGDLLSNAESGIDPGAGHLSSRAYLKAAFLSSDEKTMEKYKKKANEVREQQFSAFGERDVKSKVQNTGNSPQFSGHIIKLEDLENVLKLEIQAANVWAEKVRQNELTWIKTGVNPDSAFAATYYDEPFSEEVSKYNSRKNKDQIEEEYWLSQHLNNIGEINSLYKILELPDSTKQWIDSIYKIEFSVLPEEIEAERINLPERKTGLNTNKGQSLLVYLFGGVGGALLVILLFRFRKKKP